VKPKLYVVIISYNKIEPVIKAIKSCRESYPKSKIILIDNSENLEIFKELKHKLGVLSDIVFIKNESNLGFSKAVNQGIKIALENNADYVLLVNDDAYVDKDCIPQLLEALENNEKALLAGPTIFYKNEPNKIWHTGGYFNKLLGNIKIPYKNKIINPNSFKKMHSKEVDFLTGCVLMIKKEAYEKIGYFNEELFFYAEDLDYSLRVKKAGYKLLWVPSAFAWHDIDMKKGRTSPFVMYNLARNNIIVRKKHFNSLYFYYYLLLHFFVYTPYRVYQILRGSKEFTSIKSWFKGTLEGIINV